MKNHKEIQREINHKGLERVMSNQKAVERDERS